LTRTPVRLVFVALFLLAAAPAAAQDAPEPMPAEIRLVLPLAMRAGETVTLRVRGTGLDAATAATVRAGDAPWKAVLRSKSKSAPPNGVDAALVGDSEAVVELTVPEDATHGTATLTVETPTGQVTHSLPVTARDRIADETEPNNGFAKAQPVAPGQVVRGVINGQRDVDVFRFAGSPGSRVRITVVARSRNSALDASAIVFALDGTILATADDSGDGRDVAAEVTLSQSGEYFLTVMDALDTGSDLHAYRLSVEPVEPAGQ
jgi:hypothetical protein